MARKPVIFWLANRDPSCAPGEHPRIWEICARCAGVRIQGEPLLDDVPTRFVVLRHRPTDDERKAAFAFTAFCGDHLWSPL